MEKSLFVGSEATNLKMSVTPSVRLSVHSMETFGETFEDFDNIACLLAAIIKLQNIFFRKGCLILKGFGDAGILAATYELCCNGGTL